MTFKKLISEFYLEITINALNFESLFKIDSVSCIFGILNTQTLLLNIQKIRSDSKASGSRSIGAIIFIISII